MSGGSAGASGSMAYRGNAFAPIPRVGGADPLDGEEGEDIPQPVAPAEFTTPLNPPAEVMFVVSTGNHGSKSHMEVQNTDEFVLRDFVKIHVAQNISRLNAGEGLVYMRIANPVDQDVQHGNISYADINGEGVCHVSIALFVVLRPSKLITDLWEMVYPIKDAYKCVYIPAWNTEFKLYSGDIVLMFRKPATTNTDDMIQACANVWYCLPRQLQPLNHLTFLMHSNQAVDSAKEFLKCYRYPLNFPYTTEKDLIMQNYYKYTQSIPRTPQMRMPLYP